MCYELGNVEKPIPREMGGMNILWLTIVVVIEMMWLMTVKQLTNYFQNEIQMSKIFIFQSCHLPLHSGCHTKAVLTNRVFDFIESEANFSFIRRAVKFCSGT